MSKKYRHDLEKSEAAARLVHTESLSKPDHYHPVVYYREKEAGVSCKCAREGFWFGGKSTGLEVRGPELTRSARELDNFGQTTCLHRSQAPFLKEELALPSSLVSAFSPFPPKVVIGPEGQWTHRILTPWRSFQTDISVKAVVVGLRNTRPFPNPVPPDQLDANLYLSPMHIRLLAFRVKTVLPSCVQTNFSTQVTDVDSLRNIPFSKSICYYGFWNIVLTNIQNFISTKVGSTFTMELSVISTAQTACCLNTGLLGTLTHPWNTDGPKCRTHGRRIAWPERPASWGTQTHTTRTAPCSAWRAPGANALGEHQAGSTGHPRALAPHPSPCARSGPKGWLSSLMFMNAHYVKPQESFVFMQFILLNLKNKKQNPLNVLDFTRHHLSNTEIWRGFQLWLQIRDQFPKAGRTQEFVSF